MNIFRRVARALKGFPKATPIAVKQPVIDWRRKKLDEAAQKYGKPFRCAGTELPRQVMLRGRMVNLEGVKNLSADSQHKPG